MSRSGVIFKSEPPPLGLPGISTFLPSQVGGIKPLPQTPAIRTTRIDLGTARSDAKLEASGDFLWAQVASSSSANVRVAFSDTSNGAFLAKEGFFLAGVPFSPLYLTNDAQSGEWIELFWLTLPGGQTEALNP